MVTKADITTTFNTIFGSNKEYKDLDEFEKLYALLVIGSSSTGTTTIEGSEDMIPLKVTLPTTERTATLITATNAGTIASGAVYVSIANTGNNNATVAGGTLQSGYSIDFPTKSGETLAAINYDATATTLLIIRIQ